MVSPYWNDPPASGGLSIFTQQAHHLLFIAAVPHFQQDPAGITRELSGILASSKFVTAMSDGAMARRVGQPIESKWAHLSTVATGNGEFCKKKQFKFGQARSRKKIKKIWKEQRKKDLYGLAHGPGLVLSLFAFALAFSSRIDKTRLPDVCRPRENVNLKSWCFFKCKSCSWAVPKSKHSKLPLLAGEGQ